LYFTIISFSIGSSFGLQSKSQIERADSTTGLVVVDVTVTDKRGEPDLTFHKESFTVLEGKAAADITYFSKDEVPLRVVFVIDLSDSMSNNGPSWLEGARRAINSFIRSSNPLNEYSIIAVGNLSGVFTEWTGDLSVVEQELGKLRATKPVRGTAIYDGCQLALEKMSLPGNTKNVILLISDGTDNSSVRATYAKLRRALGESRVLLYALSPANSTDSLAEFGHSVLRELAATSGGTATSTITASETEQVLKRLARELRTQYRLGFKPVFRDGKWHSIKIKLITSATNSNLKVRTREGYVAN
jgi:Ca-activated chloride channel family protein